MKMVSSVQWRALLASISVNIYIFSRFCKFLISKCEKFLFPKTLKYWVGVQRRQWREGASLALVGHPSSNGVTIKMPLGVDVLHWPASHPHLFLLG